VARYRPGSARARHRPILLAMAGGPGQCALPLAEQFRSNLPASALRGADLVVMDPRGTGASGALDCSTIQRAGSASALSLADCARSLGPRARLYSTSATVADIEALRRALAAPRISIYAISYGTYVAQRYALAHPHAVDRLLLDSAIPLSTDPTDHTILSSNARALQTLCGDGHCQAVTADVVSDFRRVATRLRHGPPFGPPITPGSGNPGATQVVGSGSPSNRCCWPEIMTPPCAPPRRPPCAPAPAATPACWPSCRPPPRPMSSYPACAASAWPPTTRPVARTPPYPGRRPIPWPPDSSMPGRWPTGSRPACPLTPRWCWASPTC